MRKRLLCVAVVVSVVAGLVLGLRSSDQASSAPPITPGVAIGGPPVPPNTDIGPIALGRAPLVVECLELQDGDVQHRTVSLVTKNFGTDEVEVSEPVVMCEGAQKQRQDAAGEPPFGFPGQFVYECYNINHGANPNEPVRLHTLNFADHFVTVGPAVVMCEGAKKVHVTSSGLTFRTGTAGHDVWECFWIFDFSIDQQVPVSLTTANFGTDTGVVSHQYLLCEEARKIAGQPHPGDIGQRDIGHASGLVWECLLFEAEVTRHEPVSLETSNFGVDDVVVGQPALMCERASKHSVVPVITPTLTWTPTVTPTFTATSTPFIP